MDAAVRDGRAAPRAWPPVACAALATVLASQRTLLEENGKVPGLIEAGGRGWETGATTGTWRRRLG